MERSGEGERDAESTDSHTTSHGHASFQGKITTIKGPLPSGDPSVAASHGGWAQCCRSRARRVFSCVAIDLSL